MALHGGLRCQLRRPNRRAGRIDAVGGTYGLFYQKHEGSAATGYLVDHSTRTISSAPMGGRWWPYPHDATADAILADLRWLLDQESWPEAGPDGNEQQLNNK